MANYKIDLKKISAVKDNIKKDKELFKTAEANYRSVRINDVAASDLMGKVIPALNKISRGYDLLIEWLEEYISDVEITESKAIEQVKSIKNAKFVFGIFSNLHISIDNPAPIAGGLAGVSSLGSTPSYPRGGGSGGPSGGGSGGGESTVITNPYDDLLNKMKEIRSTDNLEADVKKLTDDAKALEETLSKTEDAEEKKVIQDKLENIKKQLNNAKYELEIMTIANTLNNKLKEFKTFEEYKAYVKELKGERDRILKKLSSEDKEATELLEEIVSDENFDKNKPIYVYEDKDGTHYSFEELKDNPNAKKTTFDELFSKLNKDDVNKFIDINKEYDMNQKLVTYIEETAK